MAIVSLKIGGRYYKFSCNDGQEMHMRELADGLDKKAESLIKSIGFMHSPHPALAAMPLSRPDTYPDDTCRCRRYGSTE